MIHIEPNTRKTSELEALLDSLESAGMRPWFNDTGAYETCRFCVKDGADLVDYEIEWDELEAWHAGREALDLMPLQHDTEMWPEPA